MVKLSAIGSFVAKYADEAAAIATALTNVLDGLALPKAQADKVRETINKLENAADSIVKSTSKIDVRISKDDINEAVNNYLEANLKNIVEEFIKDKTNEETNANNSGN